ncbi:hypothetical protein E6O75_ATG10626 [Venturia nashicola]|uniref:Zn(2)-C6 fungal-type domain-containing protein n=1 Tax=Venturia nashicola TaxID=86259 RepID=A0A4Z1NTX8_9PEZI|nr:hypothetical protein E6O75_ATG10626 [Venturia nashicola]
MAITKPQLPNIYHFQDLTSLGERFRVASLPHQSRRVTRMSAMPLAFDDKHLKKLLDHYCTAEKLGSWVQSAPVIAILKYWVQSTLQCFEHTDTYCSLLLPAESEEKWSDFKEDCVHVALTRIRRDHLGEPAPDPPTSAWAFAIEQLVRDSWRDDSGPLNAVQKPGHLLGGWACERACDLLHTVYESLRSEPNSGYFANLLGSFTGARHLPLPAQSRPQSTPKPACKTCQFNHIACDRSEPVCGQCKLLKVPCNKASEFTGDATTGDDKATSYPFDPLFDESPPHSEPLMELVSRLGPSPIPSFQSELSFFPRAEPTAATRPRVLDLPFTEPSFPTTGGPSPLPNTPACRACRVRHKGCDRGRPSCGECSLRSVDCVWDREGTKKPMPSIGSTQLSGTNVIALEEGEIDGNVDDDKSAGSKRARGTDVPSLKRLRVSGDSLMEALLSSVPRAIGTQAVNRAPTARMIVPSAMPAMPLSTFANIHSDRLARIGSHSPEQSSPTYEPEVTGSNSIQVSATRTSSVKVETKEAHNGFAKPQTRTVPSQFPAPHLPAQTPPFSAALQPVVKLTKRQRRQLAGGSFLPPNQRNRPNATAPAVLHAPAAVRAPAAFTQKSEEARLSSALQYCQTLFEDIMTGRNVPNAAQMGVTAIQHALGNN